jgi:hypothetical protein
MDREPKGSGFVALILAHVICCGGIVLVATGVLTVGGIGVWLLDGGLIWLGAGGLAVAVLFIWRWQKSTGTASNVSRRQTETVDTR